MKLSKKQMKLISAFLLLSGFTLSTLVSATGMTDRSRMYAIKRVFWKTFDDRYGETYRISGGAGYDQDLKRDELMKTIDAPFGKTSKVYKDMYWNVLLKRFRYAVKKYCPGIRDKCLDPNKRQCRYFERKCLAKSYPLKHQFKTDAPFIFNPYEAIEHRVYGVMGCTGASRGFFHTATELTNLEMAYVHTVVADDYDKMCPHKWKPRLGAMNGHQVVAVKFQGGWRLVDTSSFRKYNLQMINSNGNLVSLPKQGFNYAVYADTNEVVVVKNLSELKKKSLLIDFPGYPNNPYFVTSYRSQKNGSDYTGHQIFNTYASGNPNDPTCRY